MLCAAGALALVAPLFAAPRGSATEALLPVAVSIDDQKAAAS